MTYITVSECEVHTCSPQIDELHYTKALTKLCSLQSEYWEGIFWVEPVSTSKPLASPQSHIKAKPTVKEEEANLSSIIHAEEKVAILL